MKVTKGEAEEVKVLSLMFTDEEAIQSVVASNITHEHFDFVGRADKKPVYRKLFQMAVEYYFDHGRLLSTESLENEIVMRAGSAEGKGPQKVLAAYQRCLAEEVDPNALPALLERMHEHMTLTVLGDASQLVSKALKAGDTPSATFAALRNHIADAEFRLMGSDDNPTKVVNLVDTLPDMAEEYYKRKNHPELYQGIHVGIPQLDEATNGFKCQTLNLVVGEVNSGKSTVLLNWAADIHAEGRNVLFFSLEMPIWQIQARWLARQMLIPYDGFLHGKLTPDQEGQMRRKFEEWGGEDAFNDSVGGAAKFIAIDEPSKSNHTVSFIEGWIRRYSNMGAKPEAVFVDYLGEMIDPKLRGAKKWEHAGPCAAGLRRIARVYDLVMFSAQQVNRAGQRAGRKQIVESAEDQIWNPEDIADAKQAVDVCDSAIGFVTDHERKLMFFHKVKGRDWHLEEKCITHFRGEMALISPTDPELDIGLSMISSDLPALTRLEQMQDSAGSGNLDAMMTNVLNDDDVEDGDEIW